VLGFSELLAQLPGLPPTADVYLRRVATSGQALLTVVNDILDFSKLEAGQLDLDPAPFPLRGFLEDVAGLFSAQAEAKGLRMEIRLEALAPEHVYADRARLQQVLANLLSNAIKFTDSGTIYIQARYERVQQSLEVSVSDTGVGISAEAARLLFQRFSQADGSISRKYGGTGLGLSICRQLTELMGGGIDVVSAPGAGATFTFRVKAPAVDGAVEAEVGADLRDLFGRHVGREVAAAAEQKQPTLGGEERHVAVIFVDVVGSTGLVTTRGPQEVVELLNRFFSVIVDEVDRHHGMVNKFEGDACLAVFGAPVQIDNPEDEALAAARAIAVRMRREVPECPARIGVAAGQVVAGNVGAKERFEYTVIGEPVNEAARLSELARAEPSRALASATTLAAATEREQRFWRLGRPVRLRGYDDRLPIAALRGGS
jgi:class 3 adenylate cyclase